MTGPEHWAEASQILTGDADPCSYGCPHTGCEHEMAMLARAQVHAWLAVGAAVIAGIAHRIQPADRDAWLKAIDPERTEQGTGAAL